jgi:hypothetical protein
MMSKDIKEEGEGPANVTAGVAKFDPLLAPKKKMMKRFKDFKKG